MAVGALAQAHLALGEDRRPLGQVEERDLLPGLDGDFFGGQQPRGRSGTHGGWFGSGPRHSRMIVPTVSARKSGESAAGPPRISRYHSGWFWRAQFSVTVPRVIARIVPLTQMAA